MLLVDRGRITEAITTGAAWEIWAQVELSVLLPGRGAQAVREIAWPPSNQAQSPDVLAQDATGRYAIELKVESADNSGASLLSAAKNDMTKMQGFALNGPGARWVVAVGYGGVARTALSNFAAVAANNAIYQEADSIGVLVATR